MCILMMANNNKSSLHLRPWEQMIASSTGACITSLFVTPLDVVKTRLQTQQTAFMNNKCVIYCNQMIEHLCPCVNSTGPGLSTYSYTDRWINFNRPNQFSGTLDAFVKISKFEGYRSLWSGLPPALIMSVPSTVIYFTSYEQIRDALKKLTNTRANDYSFWIPLTSGVLARTGAAVIISPLELMRTKMQSKRMNFREVTMSIRLMVHHRGYLSLWRGLSPTIMRDVPFSAIYWTQYEFLKSQSSLVQPGFWYTFTCGAISGAVAGALTLPFDLVKTYRQTELGETDFLTKHSKKSSNTYQILKRIYVENGPKALFTGLVPRLIKVAPACAVMISTYELGKQYFREYNKKRL